MALLCVRKVPEDFLNQRLCFARLHQRADDAFGKLCVAVSERLRRLRERRAAVSAEKRKKLLSFAGRKNGGKLLLCEGKTFVFTIRIVHIPPPERSSCVFYAGAGER